MRISRDGVRTYGSDICSRCIKDNTECVLKKALSNYYDGGSGMPLSLILADCPEYRRTEDGNDRTSWFDFNEITSRDDSHYVTFNPNTTVRLNTGETF